MLNLLWRTSSWRLRWMIIWRYLLNFHTFAFWSSVDYWRDESLCLWSYIQIHDTLAVWDPHSYWSHYYCKVAWSWNLLNSWCYEQTRHSQSFQSLDIKARLLLPASEAVPCGTKYNVPLLNALVLYIGMQVNESHLVVLDLVQCSVHNKIAFFLVVADIRYGV